MSSQNQFNPNLKAAEAYEKAAEDAWKKGDKAKAAELLEKSADRYIDEGLFDKAVSCLEGAGRLGTRVMDLLQSFEAAEVLEVLQKKHFAKELALAYLHLQSRGHGSDHSQAFEACFSLANESLQRGTEPIVSFRFLKGAMLAASWARDESSLHKACDLGLSAKLALVGQEKQQTDRILFLITKMLVSGDFQLMPELSEIAFPSESERTFKTIAANTTVSQNMTGGPIYRGFRASDPHRAAPRNTAIHAARRVL